MVDKNKTLSTTTTTTTPQKKTFYEVLFKSREFMIDVYLRFDCFIYLILAGFGLWDPRGMLNLFKYIQSDVSSNCSSSIGAGNSGENIQDTLNSQFYTEDSGEFQFDSDIISSTTTATATSVKDGSFIALYDNPILIGIVSMYTILVSMIALFQFIISVLALVQTEKPVKSMLINLSLTLNFIMILFNLWTLINYKIFTQFATMGLSISFVISVLDFLALFILTNKYKNFKFSPFKLFGILKSLFKFKIPKSMTNNNNNKKNK